MAFYTILFSPCGRTRRIAEILEREWKEEQRICIDLCDPLVTKVFLILKRMIPAS